MATAVDITGKRFGRLTAIRPVLGGERRRWLCRCDCGNKNTVATNVLLGGISKSCGCLQIESRFLHTTHGLSKSPEYCAWKNMRQRCDYPNAVSYCNYGGRGIRYDPSWKSFEQFYRDMGPKPTPKHTIERKDSNANYGPLNCLWESRKIQARNRRTSRLFTHNGKTMCMAEWVRFFNLPYNSISARMRRGYSFEQAISQKPYQKIKR